MLTGDGYRRHRKSWVARAPAGKDADIMASGKRILCLDFGTKPGAEPTAISRKGLALLRERSEVEARPLGGVSADETKRQVLAELPGADAVVLSPWCQFPLAVTPDVLDSARRLKVIAGTFDNRFAGWVNLADLTSRGIALIDTSRDMTPTVAEFAFAMTLNLLRDIPALLELARGGGWNSYAYSCEPREVPFVFGDLHGRRIGLAGFGSINRHYARFAAPFGCRMEAFDPNVSDTTLADHGVTRAGSLVALARGCEIFVVGIPPTPSTLEVISAEVINALPPGSLFVLVTRMAVVHQPSLWDRIRRNELRAAIDVFDPEPPPADAWFRRHPNCLCSPHVAGGVFYCHERCFLTACADALAVVEGRAPVYAATPRDAAIYAGQPAGGA